MTVTITPVPVRKSITVKASQKRAFTVFTSGMGHWWIKGHSINSSPQQDVIIEPHAGGRWFERGEDGSECQWGHVIEWDPPRRIVLAWQLGADWKFALDLVTELEIRFTAAGADMTRIDLEHRNLERYGERAEAVRTAIGGDGGWPILLNAYAAALSS